MTKKTIPIRDENDETREDVGAPDAATEIARDEAAVQPGDGEPVTAGVVASEPDAQPTEDVVVDAVEDDDADEGGQDAERGPETASVGVDPAVVARLPAENERLKRALDEKDQLLQKYIAAYKKAEAEFARAKARIEGDVTRQVESARGDLARRLLGVLDDLERSLTAARGDHGNLAALLEGVEMVYKSFLGRLGDLGVERYDPANQAFDPGLHEAMGVVPVPDPAQNNRVLQVYAAGYRQGDQILRPARVIVGKHSG